MADQHARLALDRFPPRVARSDCQETVGALPWISQQDAGDAGSHERRERPTEHCTDRETC